MSTAPACPPSLFQSINPIYIILLGAALRLAVDVARAARARALDPGQVRPGAAPARLRLPGARLGRADASASTAVTPVLFLFLIYLFHTTGELCLSPVGLSAMNRLAPRAHGEPDHGRLVLRDRGRQFRRRQDRRDDRRRERRDDQGGTLDDLLDDRLDRDRRSASRVLVVSPLVKRLMHLDTLQDDEDLAGDGGARRAAGGGHASRSARPSRQSPLMRRQGCAAARRRGLALRLRQPARRTPAAAPAAKAPPAPRYDAAGAIPIPSTYRPYPGVPTAITGATIFDGEGGRIENGTIVLADGRIQAVGGADTPIPEGATRIDGARPLGDAGRDRRPLAISATIRAPASRRIRTATRSPARSGPKSGPSTASGRRIPGFSRALANGGITTLADPARLGQPVRRPRRDAAQRAGADDAGDALPGRAARPQDGLRRESQARLWRPQPDAADAGWAMSR